MTRNDLSAPPASVAGVPLGEYWHLHAGDDVARAGRVMDVAVGDGLPGRVIDPLGRPLDGSGPVPRQRAPAHRTPRGARYGPRTRHRAAPDRREGR